jgi:hypothetical protein
MPDITMCPGDKCPMRKTCHRYVAWPSDRQSYFATAPITYTKSEWKCDYYWPIKDVRLMNDRVTH